MHIAHFHLVFSSKEIICSTNSSHFITSFADVSVSVLCLTALVADYKRMKAGWCCLHMRLHTGRPGPARAAARPDRWENWLSAADDFLGGETGWWLRRFLEKLLRKFLGGNAPQEVGTDRCFSSTMSFPWESERRCVQGQWPLHAAHLFLDPP